MKQPYSTENCKIQQRIAKIDSQKFSQFRLLKTHWNSGTGSHSANAHKPNYPQAHFSLKTAQLDPNL